MKILIAGGTGLVGTHLMNSLLPEGHQIWILGRHPERMHLPAGVEMLKWDGVSTTGWGARIREMDAVVNLVGATIGAWPWTKARKRLVLSSRVEAGRALAQAIETANPRPKVLIQASGISHYGPRDDRRITEEFLAGNDFLAELTKQWEVSTRPVEKLGVRRVIIRTAIVLAAREGVLPLMALPVRLYVGGPMGNGKQGVSWIHIEDEVGAIHFLMGQPGATGAYNLSAPHPVSNTDFMRALAKVLKKPYWLRAPAFALRLGLGEMSTLLLDGQYAVPARLTDLGYVFKFPDIEHALHDLYSSAPP